MNSQPEFAHGATARYHAQLGTRFEHTATGDVYAVVIRYGLLTLLNCSNGTTSDAYMGDASMARLLRADFVPMQWKRPAAARRRENMVESERHSQARYIYVLAAVFYHRQKARVIMALLPRPDMLANIAMIAYAEQCAARYRRMFNASAK